jgi:hypothetical protein
MVLPVPAATSASPSLTLNCATKLCQLAHICAIVSLFGAVFLSLSIFVYIRING